jgi:hypothetical protein
MKKDKILKIVSIVSGTVVIASIVVFITMGLWEDALFFSAVFFFIWILPELFKKYYKTN